MPPERDPEVDRIQRFNADPDFARFEQSESGARSLQDVAKLLPPLSQLAEILTTNAEGAFVKGITEALSSELNEKMEGLRDLVDQANAGTADLLGERVAELQDFVKRTRSDMERAQDAADGRQNEQIRRVDASLARVEATLKRLSDELDARSREIAVTAVNLIEGFEGDERLDYNALKNKPQPIILSAEDIRDRLASLSGEARLDASAIKNLPQVVEARAKELSINARPSISIFDGAALRSKNTRVIRFRNNLTVSEDGSGGVIVDALGGGPGGGAVDSVNGKTGAVTLFASDVGADEAGSAASALAAAQAYADAGIAALSFQAPIALTTDGFSGPATFDGTTLNIPNYAPPDGGTVNSVAGGTGIDVDATDPANPAVSLDSLALASLALADSAVQPDDLAAVATSGAYADLSGLPSLFSGNYADLSNKPALFSGAYADLSGKPTLGTAAAQDLGYFATAAQGALADTALQPAALTGYATEAYVDAEVANMVASAPATLDTLNELAAALGDDPNFATTIATQIGTKANTGDLAPVAFSGDYDDLIGKPTIPSQYTDGMADARVAAAVGFTVQAYDADLTVWAGKTAPAGVVVGTTDTQSLSNKRVTPRIGTNSSSSTPTPSADAADQYNLTFLATNATFAAPSGTPTDGQSLVIRIKDSGTVRTLAWNAIYRAIGVTLPTATVASKTLYLGMKYNASDSKWDVIAVAQEA